MVMHACTCMLVMTVMSSSTGYTHVLDLLIEDECCIASYLFCCIVTTNFYQLILAAATHCVPLRL